MIEVFADIWCPFAYVSLHALREQRPGVSFVLRAWPLELVNDEPEDVEKTTEHVRALREQLGVPLFAGFDPRQFPTTSLPALALVAAARREGRDAATVDEWLRRAMWEDGRDIGDAALIDQLAVEYDLTVTDDDYAAVRRDWNEGQRRGVEGSPHFFCGDHDKFAAGLSVDHDAEGNIRVAHDRAGLDGFLRGCGH